MTVDRAVYEEFDILSDGLIYQGNSLAFFVVALGIGGLYVVS